MEKENSSFQRRRGLSSIDTDAPRRKMTGKRMPGANIERKSIAPSAAKAADPEKEKSVYEKLLTLNGGRSLYFGMTPAEISKMCVPSSREEQFKSLSAMNSLDKSSKEIIEPFKKRFDKWAEDKANDVDFSSTATIKLRLAVERALLESSSFLNAVHKFGMPSLVVRSNDAEKRLMDRGFVKEHIESSDEQNPENDFIHSIFDPFGNEISFSPRAFIPREVPDGSPESGDIQIDSSFSGYLRHEWGHYLHFSVLNDSERSVGIGAVQNKKKSRLLEIAEKYCSSQPLSKYRSTPFGDTPDTPRAISQLSHESLLEMFAEGISAYLHPDAEVGRKSINSVLRKDIEAVLNVIPDEPEIQE